MTGQFLDYGIPDLNTFFFSRLQPRGPRLTFEAQASSWPLPPPPPKPPMTQERLVGGIRDARGLRRITRAHSCCDTRGRGKLSQGRSTLLVRLATQLCWLPSSYVIFRVTLIALNF